MSLHEPRGDSLSLAADDFNKSQISLLNSFTRLRRHRESRNAHFLGVFTALNILAFDKLAGLILTQEDVGNDDKARALAALTVDSEKRRIDHLNCLVERNIFSTGVGGLQEGVEAIAGAFDMAEPQEIQAASRQGFEDSLEVDVRLFMQAVMPGGQALSD